MPGFIRRDKYPVAIILFGHVRKPVSCIQGEVDGVELDVGNGVHEDGAAMLVLDTTPLQVLWPHKF